jgi:threonine dehydratase
VARRLADETGRVLVPPYDDPAIMAGQGTAALELFEEVPRLDALVTPVGGGGLMAGCSTVAREPVTGRSPSSASRRTPRTIPSCRCRRASG